MIAHARQPQEPVEIYLAELREELGGLPQQDVEDVLRELRGHIAERAAAIDPQRHKTPVEEILARLGTPKEIGSLYRADALVAHARAGFSPPLIVRATIRWATKTALGFMAFLAGVLGYALGASLIVCAFLKPFFPAYIGLWINPHGMVLGAQMPRPHSQELLGWWIIPYGFGVGLAFILGTTVLLRWMLRFVPRASRRVASRP
jgi:uncharacterized membrane protein